MNDTKTSYRLYNIIRAYFWHYWFIAFPEKDVLANDYKKVMKEPWFKERLVEAGLDKCCEEYLTLMPHLQGELYDGSVPNQQNEVNHSHLRAIARDERRNAVPCTCSNCLNAGKVLSCKESIVCYCYDNGVE